MKLRSLLLAPLAACALAACGGPTVELDTEVLQVVHSSPHHGAVEVGADVLPLVGFNYAIAEDAMDALHLEREGAEGFVDVEVRRALRDKDRVVMMVPRQLLEPSTTYRIRVEPVVLTPEGIELAAEYRAEFVTVAE